MQITNDLIFVCDWPEFSVIRHKRNIFSVQMWSEMTDKEIAEYCVSFGERNSVARAVCVCVCDVWIGWVNMFDCVASIAVHSIRPQTKEFRRWQNRRQIQIHRSRTYRTILLFLDRRLGFSHRIDTINYCRPLTGYHSTASTNATWRRQKMNNRRYFYQTIRLKFDYSHHTGNDEDLLDFVAPFLLAIMKTLDLWL